MKQKGEGVSAYAVATHAVPIHFNEANIVCVFVSFVCDCRTIWQCTGLSATFLMSMLHAQPLHRRGE